MKNKLLEQVVEFLAANGLPEDEIKKAPFLRENILYTGKAARTTEHTKPQRSLMELYAGSMERIRLNRPSASILSTGYTTLDNHLAGGLYPGELVVIGARPGMGKTQLATNIALEISKASAVLYFSFDLTPELLTLRILSALTAIPVARLLKNELTPKERKSLETISGNLLERDMAISDSAYDSMDAMRNQIAHYKNRSDIRLVVIDYLHLMNLKGFRENRHQEISYICRELKNIAKAESICIVLLSQLGRGVEARGGRRAPLLVDLMDSGAIEHYADKVLFLYRPEMYHIFEDDMGFSTEGLIEISIGKNNHGQMGTVKLLADKHFTSFTDYEQNISKFNIDPGRLDDLDED